MKNLTISTGHTNINTEKQSEINKTPKSLEINTSKTEEEQKEEIIFDILIDSEVLDLSIQALNKLIKFLNPTNSTFDHGNNPIYQFK